MGVDSTDGTSTSSTANLSNKLEKRPERRSNKIMVPPSHPDFDRSRFSDEEFIDLLQFENKEVQSTLKKAEDRVQQLEQLLRQNNIPLPSPTKLILDEHVKALSPIAEDEVPQRSARRRLGSVSIDNDTSSASSQAGKRTSVASITSNGPIDVVAGVPISLNFKSELMAAAALESTPIRDNNVDLDPIIQNMPIKASSSNKMKPINKETPVNVNENASEDASPMLDKEPEFTNVAPQYVSPNLLQDEFAVSISSPDIHGRRTSATSSYSVNSLTKQASESCLPTSHFKPRIRLPSSKPLNLPGQEKHPEIISPELLNPYANPEQSEVSTIGTGGSLRSSHTQFDSSRDSRYSSKIIPQTPQVPNTPDGFGTSMMTPVLTHNDTTTLGSATYFDSSYPISPVQRTPKTRSHRDFFKIPNALSFGSTDSVANKSTTTSSFLVLTQPEDDDVPLFIKPEDFHTVRIRVVSTISLNAKKSDDPNCTFSINDRDSGKEMWRIRKSLSQILIFDNEIRPVVEFFGLPALPEKSLFSSFTPSKVDSRLRFLQEYFDTIFNMPHIPQIVLFRICRYISLDFVNPLDDFKSGARKEGFLIRRYKGLGTTWKVRWCQIDGPSLEIYELPGGVLLEQIKLGGSQIGRQSSDVVAEERGYRHAFLIIEGTRNSKISSSPPKHFFCAESDEERDNWIASMVEFTDNDPLNNPDHSSNLRRSNGHGHEEDPNKTMSLYNPALDESIPFEDHKDTAPIEHKDPKEEKRMKKRSMFNFRSRTLSNEAPKPDSIEKLPTQPTWQPQENMQTYLDQMNLQEEPTVRVFGQELLEVFKLSHHQFKGIEIPSICFRCFEFLDRKGAIYEEGIFRLSGSASAIRQLKQKFNISLDIDLFETQLAPDVHTIAGLLKLYLRELPNSVFGRETYGELQLLITENSGVTPSSKIALMIRDHLRTGKSVNPINYDFCVIIFGFLRSVIAQSAVNRMSLKNVCIVFVPTLNISVDILSLCLVDYDCIFGDAEPIPDNKREVLDLQIPTF